MPTLLSVKEVLRFDGAFVVSSLLPYWHRHGARGVLAVELTSPGATSRGVLDLDAGRLTDDAPTMTWTLPQATFAALCQGKASAEATAAMQFSGPSTSWQLLLAACRPQVRVASAARDVASEGVLRVKVRDFKRDHEGKAIKGVVLDDHGRPPAPPVEPARAPVDSGKTVAADPAAFAAANIAAVLAAVGTPR